MTGSKFHGVDFELDFNNITEFSEIENVFLCFSNLRSKNLTSSLRSLFVMECWLSVNEQIVKNWWHPLRILR